MEWNSETPYYSIPFTAQTGLFYSILFRGPPVATIQGMEYYSRINYSEYFQNKYSDGTQSFVC